jgi:hypothetical protein
VTHLYNDNCGELALGAKIRGTHMFSWEILSYPTDILYATFSFIISHLSSEIAALVSAFPTS